MSLPNLFRDSNRALTFAIGDGRFGIDVRHILAFTDSFGEITSATQPRSGFVGYLDYRDTLVQVFECASALNRPRERDRQRELIEQLETYRQAHIDWVIALERAIQEGVAFTQSRDPRLCAFGKWYYSFSSRDEGLQGLLNKLEKPHNQIHALADSLLALRAQGQVQRAVRLLEIEKVSTLKNLLRTLRSIQDYLNTSIHPVVLHLTQDGQTPWFSLILDQIDEIIDYDPARLDRTATQHSGEPLEGYVRDSAGSNFMMLSVEKLHQHLTGKFAASA